MDNKSLVTISMEMARMAAELVETGGELTPEMEDLLNLTEGDLRTKVDRYKMFQEALNANSLYLRDLEVQFKNGRQAAENRIESMKANIKYAMSQMGTDVLEGTAWLFKRSKIKPKLVIAEGVVIPSKYYKEETQVVKVLDKEALMADLALGALVAGVTLEDNYMVRSYVNKPGRAKAVKEIEG